MMIWGLAALTGWILAIITRRPLRALLHRRFRYAELLWIGAGAQTLFSLPLLSSQLSSAPVPGLPQLGGWLYSASLLLLLLFIWSNRHHASLAVIGFGLLMNAMVIIANGGRMPVSPEHLASQGALDHLMALEKTGAWSSHSVASESTRLAFLGDWILMPKLDGGSVVLSPGDFVIAAGIVLFFLVIPEALRLRRRLRLD